MMGKFLVVALCFSLAQVYGAELEDAIANGLNKASEMRESGLSKIEAAKADVESTSNLIPTEAQQFVKRSLSAQENSRKALKNVAQTMEKNAKKSNKPDTVLTCISRSEANGNSQIQILTTKFEADMNRLQNTKMNNIKTYGRPLTTMPSGLQIRYDGNVRLINNCKVPNCVETANNSFASWLVGQDSTIAKILEQVSTAYETFQQDATNYYENSQKQVQLAEALANRKMMECLY